MIVLCKCRFYLALYENNVTFISNINNKPLIFPQMTSERVYGVHRGVGRSLLLFAAGGRLVVAVVAADQ